MKTLCRIMVHLYPPTWRRRYQREFFDLLGDMPASTYREVWDVFRGVLRAWADTVWRSEYGVELTVALVILFTGIVNACLSVTGSDGVWRSSAFFLVMAMGTILGCGVTGFLAARRSASVARSASGGLMLTLSALLIPAAVLMAVAFAFESTADPMPIDQFPLKNGSLSGPVLMRFTEGFKQSKEWFAHWGRSVGLSLMATLIAGTLMAWIGGCVQLVLRRLIGKRG